MPIPYSIDQQIMNELLLHEAGLGARQGALATASSSSKSPTPGDGSGVGDAQRDTSSSEGDGEGEGTWTGVQTIPENSGDESSDEEFTMKVYCSTNTFVVETNLLYSS